LISLYSSSQKFKFLKYSKNVSISTGGVSFLNEMLNGIITEKEVLDAIKGLKNNKAPSSDKLINEFFKNSPLFLVSIYTKLFNVVLDTGIIPETWTTGIINS
jgi:hypothetical protein